MTEYGFWWASVEGREPEVVRVSAISFDCNVAYATGSDFDIELDRVRLIERVLPAGRAAAAVAKLGEALAEPGSWTPWTTIKDAIGILQGENQA